MTDMGWWIFKSAKEKQLAGISKRLRGLERLLYEEQEDDLIQHLDDRLDRIEKTLTEPETPETPAPGAPPTAQGLGDQTAIARQLWDKCPVWARPIVNNLAKARLGKSVDELMQDSEELQKTLTGLGQAAGGIVTAVMNRATPGQQAPAGSPGFGRIPEEMPMPTGNIGSRQEIQEKKKPIGPLIG